MFFSEATISWWTIWKPKHRSVFSVGFTAGTSYDLLWLVQKASSNTSGNGVIPNTAVRWNSLSSWWIFNLLCSCPFQMVTFQFSLHWDSVDVHFLRKMYLLSKGYHSVFSSGNRLMKTINYSIQEYLKRWLADDSCFLGLVFINFYINSPNVQLDWNVLWNCHAFLKLGSSQPLETVERCFCSFCEIKYGLHSTRKDKSVATGSHPSLQNKKHYSYNHSKGRNCY